MCKLAWWAPTAPTGLGQIKLQTLAERGVDVSRMVPRAGTDTQACIAYIDAASGERVFSALHNPAHDALTLDELDRDYITIAEYLHLDGRHPEAALQAARWMRAAGKMVMVDGPATRGGWPIAPIMPALIAESDVLICGAGFGPDLTGLTDVWEIGRALLAMGPRVVVQTEGRQGSYTVTREEQFHTPGFQVDVVDTTGCGDVFHRAYIVADLHGWDVRQAVQFATAASALKATRLGGRAGIPTFDQTVAFLREGAPRWQMAD